MQTYVCPITGVPYVIIDGKMYLLRENLAKSPLSYIPTDLIKRVGQGNNHSYYELEVPDVDTPYSVGVKS
jgi:hypothetical protein